MRLANNILLEFVDNLFSSMTVCHFLHFYQYYNYGQDKFIFIHQNSPYSTTFFLLVSVLTLSQICVEEEQWKLHHPLLSSFETIAPIRCVAYLRSYPYSNKRKSTRNECNSSSSMKPHITRSNNGAGPMGPLQKLLFPRLRP